MDLSSLTAQGSIGNFLNGPPSTASLEKSIQKAGESKSAEMEEARHVASAFETVLWKKYLDEATKPMIQSEWTQDSTRSSIYRDMMNHALATSIVSSMEGQGSISSALAAQLFPPGRASETDETSAQQ